MAGLSGGSDDEVEVLDLTTPLPPAPRSRLKTSTTTTATSSRPAGTGPPPPPSPSPITAHKSSGRTGADGGEGESDGSSDEDSFSMDYRPLRERLEGRANSAAAAGRTANGNTGAVSAGRNASPSQPAAAAATTATARRVASVLSAFSDDDEDGSIDTYVGGGKGKAKARDDEMEEAADYMACTQESEVVDLLSDSGDDAGNFESTSCKIGADAVCKSSSVRPEFRSSTAVIFRTEVML